MVDATPDTEANAMRALERLTPGGSEFYNNVPNCEKWIADRQEHETKRFVKHIIDRRAIQASHGRLFKALVAVLDVMHPRHTAGSAEINRFANRRSAGYAAVAQARKLAPESPSSP